MEFIYINNKNLKVIFSEKELKDRSLKLCELDYSDPKTKSFFWEIMDTAYLKTGFDVRNAKLSVKIFPSIDGGGEMFITKSTIHNNVLEDNDGDIVVIDDADKLYMLCDRIRSYGYNGVSSLYIDENDSFYLVLSNVCKMPSYISKKYRENIDSCAFASDYGSVYKLNTERLAYLEEHMRKICDGNAIQSMTK